jgi:tetratricopeptide (TPR) repeat protein
VAAGRRSYTAADDASAAILLGRAVSLEEPTGREGVERLVELAWSLLGRGEFAEARARNEQALALAQSLGDRALELRAECELAFQRTTTDLTLTAEEAVALGHEAVRELGHDGDERALAAAWNLVAMGENLRARWGAVQPALENVIEHAGRAGDRRLQRDALRSLPGSFFWGPTSVAEGLSRAEDLLESVRGQKALEVAAIRPVAGFYAMQGRFDEGRELLARARAIHEELANPLDFHTLGGFWAGPLEMLAGEPASAEDELRSACEFFLERGEQGLLSTLAAFLAQALYAQGRFDEASRWVDVSREAATSDDYDAQAQWRLVEAKLLAQRNEYDEAEAVAREGIEVINRSDELDNQAHVQLALVEVLRLAGRYEDAILALDDAIARFEQKGNIVMTERSRALRDELGRR